VIPDLSRLYACSLGILFFAVIAPPAEAEIRLDRIKLPPGFVIDTYATKVEGARSLALGPDGVVFVGSRSPGKVYALIDRNKDHKADEVIVVAGGLHSPNGVAYRHGSLYVAEISRIIRFDNIARRLSTPPKPVVVNDTFPQSAHHGWKFIGFGPDGKLYVPVGAPCNICLSDDPRHASIMRMNPDGSGLEIFARGVRNTVGFDWHPRTKELWFTDNGRDWMGSDLPPDELNCAPQKGLHFGFPYCHAGAIPDPEWGGKESCTGFVPPRRNLGPHVAALGMRFYTGAMFPAEYGHKIFIAEHGSWNRVIPIGYMIAVATEKDGKVTGYEAFAEGWLQGLLSWGRPVDVLVMPDGALLISDDKADAIYRISYRSR
jgi:glucose/arabinose dehydrogenase